MSAPPRGPRGGRGGGPRGRGSGRGGASSNARGAKSSDGNESDSGRKSAQRGRGRGTLSQNQGRGIAQAFQAATRQQNAPRGGRGGSREGSRVTTPTPTQKTSNTNGHVASSGARAGETPEQRFQRVRSERNNARDEFQGGGNGKSTGSLGLLNAQTMVGLCQDMCPEYERARRIYQRDVWAPEKVRSGRTVLLNFVLAHANVIARRPLWV